MIEDKKQLYVIIGAFLILAISMIILVIQYNNSTDTEKSFLVRKVYVNYAFGFNYGGKAIDNRGKIYEWFINETKYHPSEKDDKYYLMEENDTEENFRLFVDKYAKKTSDKVDKDDLKKMSEYIDLISKDDNFIITNENAASDAGAFAIEIFKDNKPIRLYLTGDHEGNLNNEKASELVELINKYIEKVND